MEKFNEQFDRFYAVLAAKDKYGLVCTKCPLEKQCEEASKTMTITEIESGPTCEEVLLQYILTGETPE